MGAGDLRPDELSVGLASVIIDEIFEAITALRSEGRTLLIVEQYVGPSPWPATSTSCRRAMSSSSANHGNAEDSSVFQRYLGRGSHDHRYRRPAGPGRDRPVRRPQRA